jgi:hypothetical protein
MRLEGVDDRLAGQIARATHHRLEDRAVAEVDAVEVPDRNDRTPQRAVERIDSRDGSQC